MDALLQQPARYIVDAIKSKTVSSLEVTQAYLQRIKAVNPKLNAVIQMDEALTLAEAHKADAAIGQQATLGPLHGLPITIKDTIDIFNYKNSRGSHLYKNYHPKTEGTCVTRLRAAGAVILGLTNAPELLTAYESDNLLYGATNNPYDLARSAGGSSGGEAAIISANGSPLGLGSDGGGSIRVPAHYCGIAGIKPTQGLVPITGIAMLGYGAGCLQAFGTYGPMARFVDDLVLALPVLSGPDKYDPNTYPVVLDAHKPVDISELKVAYFLDNGIVTPDKAICNVVLDAVAVIADYGATVEEARPANIERTYELHWETFFALNDGGINAAKPFADLAHDKISPLRQQFNENAKRSHLNSAELNQLFAEIAQFKWSTYEFLNQYDIIICPPCASLAKPHGKCLDEVKDFTYTMSFNNSGSPAVVVRAGTSAQGLPIGVQVVANHWRDYQALAVANVLEQHLGGWQWVM